MNPLINLGAPQPAAVPNSGGATPQQEGANGAAFANELQQKIAGKVADKRDKSGAEAKTSDGKAVDEKGSATGDDKGDKRIAELLAELQNMLTTGQLPDGTPLTKEQLAQIQQMVQHIENGKPVPADTALINTTGMKDGEAPAAQAVTAKALSDTVKDSLNNLAAPRAFAAINLHTSRYQSQRKQDEAAERATHAVEKPIASRASEMSQMQASSAVDTAKDSAAALRQPGHAEVAVEKTSLAAAQESAHSPAHPAATETPFSTALNEANKLAAAHASAAGSQNIASATLKETVGTQAWQQAINQHVSVFLRDGINQAELHLHPAELGALKINLSMENDVARLHFASAHHEVRAIIESSLSNLRTSLADAGIQLGQSSVGPETFSGFAGQQDQASSGGQSGAQDGSSTQTNGDDAEIPRERTTARIGGVDTFA